MIVAVEEKAEEEKRASGSLADISQCHSWDT